MSNSRYVVTVSRLWHEPQVRTTITPEGIALQLPLDDFVRALKYEVGSVAFTFRQASFDKQLDAAVTRVLEGVKAESAKVV